MKIKVKLSGTDGNVFALMGRVSAAMKKNGQVEEAKQMANEVMQCHSYDEALQTFMKYVDVS